MVLGKCKNVRSQSAHDYSNISMRRTASLDTIYLTGHWPRESMYLSNLQVDRSTQVFLFSSLAHFLSPFVRESKAFMQLTNFLRVRWGLKNGYSFANLAQIFIGYSRTKRSRQNFRAFVWMGLKDPFFSPQSS